MSGGPEQAHSHVIPALGRLGIHACAVALALAVSEVEDILPPPTRFRPFLA